MGKYLTEGSWWKLEFFDASHSQSTMVVPHQTMLVFGPVPSRRLGRSLGINNIPPKFCSYSCVYCELGKTLNKIDSPRTFYRPEDIRQAVVTQVDVVHEAGETIDYLTFIPDGEPTLDAHLGEAIDLLRPLGIKVAVITNGSLVWRPEVRSNLNRADWVSFKVDTVDEAVWRQLNRPCEKLRFADVLQGMEHFAHQFQGELCTETMLVAGVNDQPAGVGRVAKFPEKLKPHKAYVSIPTRPPAEPDVRAPDEATINQAVQIIRASVRDTEYLIGYEGDAFSFTGDAEHDLLSITAVHPLHEDAVYACLMRANQNWDLVQKLIAQDLLKQVDFAGNRFYVRSVGK